MNPLLVAHFILTPHFKHDYFTLTQIIERLKIDEALDRLILITSLSNEDIKHVGG